jgi:hypothetical protein
MATWYVDPVNGNDSYSGDSWALALSGTDGQTYGTTKFTSASGGFTGKENRLIRIVSSVYRIVAVVSDTEVTLSSTISTGSNRSFWIGGAVKGTNVLYITAFGSYGDVVKYAKTGNWSSAGTLTYTPQSDSVAMGSGRIALIDDCESGWTGVTNVTASQDASASYLAIGAYSTKLVVASAFTTGKMAFKDLGAGNELDLSAFQGISLILSTISTSIPASCLKVCLCSDPTGDVVVDTLYIQGSGVFYNAGMRAIKAMRDGGGNLGSSIRSIALYADVDPSTPTIYLDNIVAIKSLGDANHICHHCILSQGSTINDLHWSILGFIDATHIKLTGQWYGGTAGEVASYKVEPCVWDKTPITLAGNSTWGTLATPIVNSGGWNPSTDIQDGISCYTYQPYTSSYDYAVSLPTSYDYVKITNWLFTYGTLVRAYAKGWTLEDCGWVGWLKKTSMAGLSVSYSSYSSDGAQTHFTLRRCWFAGICNYGILISNSGIADTYEDQLCDWYWEDVTVYSCTGIQTGDLQRLRAKNLKLCNSHNGTGWKGWYAYQRVCYENEIIGFTLKDNLGTHCALDWGGCGSWKIWNLVASGNQTGTMNVANHKIHLYNAQIADATKYTDIQRSGEYVSLKDGGVADAHTIANYWGTIVSDSSTRHTGSGIAWKFSPTNTVQAPMRHRLAQVAVEGGVATTIGVYMRRDNTGVGGRLFIPGGQLTGLDDDLSDTMTVAQNQWELVSVSFTPSETGVIDVWVEVWGGTTYNLWIDDFSVVV